MVINRGDMKRKRREECPSPLLDDSPKRTKVHAQRKFAQGSNVNSPVITPVKEIERQDIDVLPEPVELLPIKRPNTEDFLTFLCFRGTPILPPSLNFFNTASIVDTNGQVHEIKSESPKNGPIDTSIIKPGCGSSERPFVAFGVRKRADPIVISRQMDRKRRHALALQALRRKYQEQRMAKIRAVTISKLSEKVSSKTLVRSNSVSKTETVTKKNTPVQKPKVIEGPKETKVETRSVKTGLRPQIKQKMCLRSFRGRFVQKELQFRNVKKRMPMKKLDKNGTNKTENEESNTSDYSSDDEKPLSKTSVEVRTSPKIVVPKVAKKSAPGPKKPAEINFRITRSSKFLNNKIVLRRQQIKQRMLLTTPKTIVKPRTLRSHTAQKGRILSENKQKIFLKSKNQIKNDKKETPSVKKQLKTIPKVETKENIKAEDTNVKKEPKTSENPKKVAAKVVEQLKKEVSPTPVANKNKSEKAANVKNEKTTSVKNEKPTNVKNEKPTNVKNEKPTNVKNEKVTNVKTEKPLNVKNEKPTNVKNEKPTSVKNEKPTNLKNEKPTSVKNDKPTNVKNEKATNVKNDKPTNVKNEKATNVKSDKPTNVKNEKATNVKNDKPTNLKNDKPTNVKKEIDNAKKAKAERKQTLQSSGNKAETAKASETEKEVLVKKKPTVVSKKGVPKVVEKKESPKKEPAKVAEESDKKSAATKTNTDQKETVELRTSQRPSRKTKEAATIYMEILSHKLVNESKIDDDNISIDSFPELPNVKKTEQRENELKAKAQCTKTSESELSSDAKKPLKPKEKEAELTESKILRSNEKKKINVPKPIEKPLKSADKPEEKKNVKGGSNAVVKKEVTNEEEKIKKTTEENKKTVVKSETVKEETCDRKTRSSNTEKSVDKAVGSPLEKAKETELKVHINPIDIEDKKKVKAEITEPPAKKKCNEKITDDVNVETNVSDKESKSKKPDQKTNKSNDEDTPKRQTRNSSQNIRQVDSDDSDESFHADIIIPRKKQVTRSKIKSHDSENGESPKSVKKSLRANARSYKECSSSESDHSTTSDVNLQQIKTFTKNKKFTKTRGQQKDEQSFSDSDEEPLSKLTQSKTREVTTKDETISEKKIKVENEGKSTKNDKDTKEKPVENEEKESSVKPKRECAKRPQNYLPMFSSSDEDDSFFHGFRVNKDETSKPKSTKVPETGCSHLPPTSDLSFKDIGRRFGKGKVNMSTEQIEKWLKDSAMAGSSVKNENDAMLKFGEKIPTETSHSVASLIDTEKLKTLLIAHVDKRDARTEKKDISPKLSEPESVSKQSTATKHTMTDRKLIFRNKDKGSIVSNTNAFSASNENSVYAFGEEAEDVMKTPFRRPNRRPSSNATSRSEDESSKMEEVPKTGQFRRPSLLKQDSVKSKDSALADEPSEEKPQQNIEENAFNIPPQPQLPSASNKNKSIVQRVDKKPTPSTSMVPPSTTSQKPMTLKHPLKPLGRPSDASEESKYKVPSSPSASSSSSAKLYRRQGVKPKLRTSEVLPVKLPDFPLSGACGQLVEAPTFHPSEKEFQDPLEYIEKIRSKAEQFGICRIVPPATFKPDCKVNDDMRFTAYNQYVHKMLHRWGPNFKELMAIKKYLSTQNITLTHPPWIGGMEIDLPRLYQTVQSLGGLKEVIEKKKWPKVSEAMKIPKSAQDRVTKLDDIYCKYLLPYDTLSPAEREKLFDEVETEWAKRESKSLLKAQQDIDATTTDGESESEDEDEECIVKGRNMALNAFYRIARNTMSMWFKNSEPLPEEVEQEFWKHVTQKQCHICVHSGSIDSGNWGYGFAVSKNSPFARHAWNLKVLTNNSGSVLRSMGPIMGMTVPTLHVGMVFSSCCWYRDPHSLPWIEYLHTGGSKIWYGIPNSISAAFHSALKSLVPNYCRNKSLWLPSDTVMVPPNLLVEYGVSLCRLVQEPGQFVVVFPKVFTSSLSTGYVVSESVYFAPPYWLKTGRTVFDELRNSCEPSMFSFDRLLLSIVNDPRSNVEVLKQIIPAVQELCDKDKSAREKIKSLGVSATEKLPLPETPQVRKKRKLQNDDGEYECEICSMNLFVSMVIESQEDAVYCLDHAAEQIENKKIQSKNCKLSYTYDEQELDGLVGKINMAISNKLQKKVPNKYAGMPTLLTK